MPASDPLDRVLRIDLSNATYEVTERLELFAEALGGAGVAIRLLDEHCPQGADPLGPENPIVFAVGPLVGLYPLASKTVAMFKSPLTGNLGESHAGGRSAVSIRMAGYGAIVITGRSPSPTYLVIDDERVTFRDASALWGLRSSATAGSVLREREGGSGHRSILRIGPAGEAGIRYACVITETYRHFGRLGLGAVFGSKRLKGIVIRGNRTLPVADAAAYRRRYDLLFRAATSSPAMRKYHDLGTAMNVLPLNEVGALPSRNLRAARFEAAEAISGEAMAARFLGRRLACSHCPVACIHLAALRTPHPHEPYFYKTSMLGYDYELIYALGSLLGVAEPEGILRLADEVEVQGLDALSTGVVLAWATEAYERGLVTAADLDGVALAWGDADAYAKAVRQIVRRTTDFYRALGRGVDHAASVYGGGEFALALGRNEMPGYHTGPACHVGFLTGSRHSHLDSAGYSLDQKTLASGARRTEDEVVRALIAEEEWRQVLSSLVVCFFARGLYVPDAVSDALAALGVEIDPEGLAAIGAATLRRKWAFKRREGFDPNALRIPERICETETPLGRVDADEIRRLVARFAAILSG
ncbi:MAG: aldehyde ferredoxin oxidoreductase N-terminal domain-containing protein [Candidatus Bipolaricaulis sp.]|nr:aldehyde ferredoxin oxidoreductase N-terminal domain-containing protein [Candidatus Bipolaricaulis sp.]